MFGVCVNFKIRAFQWSAVQLCGEIALGKGAAKDSYHNYCRQQHQSVSRTAQLSDDSTGPTCIAGLDSGAQALTNAQNRPALLQLNSVHRFGRDWRKILRFNPTAADLSALKACV